jgi:hypothetical protein
MRGHLYANVLSVMVSPSVAFAIANATPESSTSDQSVTSS